MPKFPKIVYGLISSTAETSQTGLLKVRLTNLANGETVDSTTSNRGEYVFDAQNFASGTGDAGFPTAFGSWGNEANPEVELSIPEDYPIYDADVITVANAKIEFK